MANGPWEVQTLVQILLNLASEDKLTKVCLREEPGQRKGGTRVAKRLFQEIETVINKAKKNQIKNKGRGSLLKGGVQVPTDASLIWNLIHQEFPSGWCLKNSL